MEKKKREKKIPMNESRLNFQTSSNKSVCTSPPLLTRILTSSFECLRKELWNVFKIFGLKQRLYPFLRIFHSSARKGFLNLRLLILNFTHLVLLIRSLHCWKIPSRHKKKVFSRNKYQAKFPHLQVHYLQHTNNSQSKIWRHFYSLDIYG